MCQPLCTCKVGAIRPPDDMVRHAHHVGCCRCCCCCLRFRDCCKWTVSVLWSGGQVSEKLLQPQSKANATAHPMSGVSARMRMRPAARPPATCAATVRARLLVSARPLYHTCASMLLAVYSVLSASIHTLGLANETPTNMETASGYFLQEADHVFLLHKFEQQSCRAHGKLDAV